MIKNSKKEEDDRSIVSFFKILSKYKYLFFIISFISTLFGGLLTFYNYKDVSEISFDYKINFHPIKSRILCQMKNDNSECLNKNTNNNYVIDLIEKTFLNSNKYDYFNVDFRRAGGSIGKFILFNNLNQYIYLNQFTVKLRTEKPLDLESYKKSIEVIENKLTKNILLEASNEAELLQKTSDLKFYINPKLARYRTKLFGFQKTIIGEKLDPINDSKRILLYITDYGITPIEFYNLKIKTVPLTEGLLKSIIYFNILGVIISFIIILTSKKKLYK